MSSIPLFKVFMSADSLELAALTLKSGYIGQGPEVDKFEAELLREHINAPYIATTNSGTSALHLALHLSELEAGDEVITTPMTCLATNTPIVAMRGRIVWADIDPRTGNIDPEDVAKKITSRTRAIICVNWGGNPCHLLELKTIADSHGIKLIEDAAHSFSSSYNNSKTGSHAHYTCYSFQAIKHLTTVDGGAITVRTAEEYRRVKLLRWYGIDREGPRRDFRCEQDVHETGYKFHMNDVSASVGLGNIPHMQSILQAHRENATYLHNLLSSLSSRRIRPAHLPSDRQSSHWLFTLFVNDQDQFIKHMMSNGVTASRVHARNDSHTAFTEFRADLPGVDEFARTEVCIPVGWWLSAEDRNNIAEAIQSFDAR